MSVLSASSRAAPGVQTFNATIAADFLLLATVFTITLANVRWTLGTADINLSDILASVFIVAFLTSRVASGDRAWPRTALYVTAFFLLFAVVYLAGYFNLETLGDRDQFSRGMVKFVIHFVFLIAAVVHVARRSERFYWRLLAWFTAGLVANGIYGLVELGYAETADGNLDRALLTSIGSFQRGGINVFGAVDGADVFRPNALTLDPQPPRDHADGAAPDPLADLPASGQGTPAARAARARARLSRAGRAGDAVTQRNPGDRGRPGDSRASLREASDLTAPPCTDRRAGGSGRDRRRAASRLLLGGVFALARRWEATRPGSTSRSTTCSGP